jgi:hypothetical protein
MGNAAGSKPGYVFGADRTAYFAARERYIHDIQEAWRGAASADKTSTQTSDAKQDAYEEYRQRIQNGWRAA